MPPSYPRRLQKASCGLSPSSGRDGGKLRIQQEPEARQGEGHGLGRRAPFQRQGLEGAEKKSWVQAGAVPRGEGVWAHGVGEKEE
jgi:hypothetical protein